MGSKSLSSWKEEVADKQQRQKAAIPKEWLVSIPEDRNNVMDIPETCGLLTDRELQITSTSDVSVVLEKLATAEWSALEVTTAFSKRAIIAHQAASASHLRYPCLTLTNVLQTNCLTEIFIDKALERAAELDAYLKEHGKVIGPLHGLPVSLKDQIPIRGLETTMGKSERIVLHAVHA